ncbi:MAG: acyl-CoA synthetase [Betaproteobacteria bacterium]|nr:acyl-CoA synthetase [Betaproteobacteria bacterium]
MARRNPYQDGLERNRANYVPLTPVSFLARAAEVYPDRIAVIHGGWRLTWREVDARSRRLASALRARGIGEGDTVAFMASNTPHMVEAHFGVPMTGAVLNTLNTRLDAAAIAFMLDHGEAKFLFTDREFSGVVAEALRLARGRPVVVDIDDPLAPAGERLGETDYEAFIAGGDPSYRWDGPGDEWDAIALSYTSGTTGNPKGVVTHHRGAYLNAVCNAVTWAMPHFPVYLWTLPMFHCNGWCFPWSIALLGGTHVCLRRVEAKAILDAIREHGVTHYCGAPIVHSMLINAPEEWKHGIEHKVSGLVAAASPPASMIEGMERMGFDITHVYGLTEVYGPASVCAKYPEWDALSLEDRVERNGRQGVRYALQEGMDVRDPESMEPVPRDGATMGEIMFRGNITMKGYLKNPAATEEAFAGGWYHTGDLAVMNPDGYVKIKDRSKDIIISGGENISSIEVEDILYRHPAVLDAAVVARPDPKWGETPCAFVAVREGAQVTEAEIIAFCRERLAHYKSPRTVIFGPIPKTSTGKIQKNELRARFKQD